jgi:hypothetical protein
MRACLNGLALLMLMVSSGCGRAEYGSAEMAAQAQRLRAADAFQYPLDNYFPETAVTDAAPPSGELYHAAEDSFAPAGTPVRAIGDGIISYSGKARGYGWLIIIDHPTLNVYSLYGHLSTNRWKKTEGNVKKGEVVAYLATGEEGETMVPHIHFGMRLGQRADYPRLGNRRWMAGYTHTPPERLGWFDPSEIIGETEAMREWNHRTRKREGIAFGQSTDPADFRISNGLYNEREDLDRAVRDEFGDDYRLADWQDILPFKKDIEPWADAVGLEAGRDKALLISNEGWRIWLSRQYFITRFNHGKPRDYLAHESINDDFACLGSWYGLRMRLLAVKK